jgi:intracellular sulfur oxidation DsrE/DsrF family protein
VNTAFLKRRRFVQWLTAAGGLFTAARAGAHHTDTHFEDRSTHQIVYQCNKADGDYLQHVFFSVGEVLRKYGDDVEIVVAAFGPGIHVLAKHPMRPIPPDIPQRVASLAAYGVSFHACNNTLKGLNWTEQDLTDLAVIVESGVDDIMLLQEKGFSYISW